jgi:predicted DNA-binding transcriptional regulator
VLHILTHQPFNVIDLLLAEIEDVIRDGMGVARQLPYDHWIGYICSWIAPDEGVASTYHNVEKV